MLKGKEKMDKKVNEKQKVEIGDVFKLLSNPIRLNILLLLEDCPQNVNEIVSKIEGVSQPQISRQLSILRNANVVNYEKQGKKSVYSLEDPDIICIIDSSIERIMKMDV